MSRPRSLYQPPESISDGVLSKEQASGLAKRLVDMCTSTSRAGSSLVNDGALVQIRIKNEVRSYTRFALNRITGGLDRIQTQMTLTLRDGGISSNIEINQFDDASLQASVDLAKTLAKQNRSSSELEFYALGPQRFEPTDLWRDTTAKAQDAANRGETIKAMMGELGGTDMVSAGSVMALSGSQYMTNNFGMEAYMRFTDSECNITARTKDGTGSGWAASSHRDFNKIDYKTLVAKATDIARRSQNPEAIEPGNRTVILSPAAVGQIMMMIFRLSMNAKPNDDGGYPFSKKPPEKGSKWGQRVLDSRINWMSDPADPDGGYFPFDPFGFPHVKTQWIENGRLRQLYYTPGYAAGRGKRIIPNPYSVRFYSSAKPVSVDDMIASCKEGFYVNRISNVSVLDMASCVLTGVTRDGIFLIKNGKIDRPAKNFRFADSPFLFFNQVDAIGAPERVSLGYSPEHISRLNEYLQPMICPPIMVRDFAFTQLSDAI